MVQQQRVVRLLRFERVRQVRHGLERAPRSATSGSPGLAIDSITVRHIVPGLAIHGIAMCHIVPGLAIHGIAMCHIVPGLAIDSITVRHIVSGLAIDSSAVRHVGPGLTLSNSFTSQKHCDRLNRNSAACSRTA